MTLPAGRQTSNCRTGFTLIEVLVAVLILSTGIVFVLRAFDTAVGALAVSRDALDTHLFLKEKISELDSCNSVSIFSLPSAGSEGGFQWKSDIKPLDGCAEPGLYTLTVKAFPVNSQGIEYSLSTVVWISEDTQSRQPWHFTE